MTIYSSKSSIFVKVVTAGTVVLLSLVIITLLTSGKNGFIGGIILSVIMIAILIYFYARSLDKIILHNDTVILKRNIGQIKLPVRDITEVKRLNYSNLSMTSGSKGVFGFIGNTMDDSISLVKDRKNMIRISTKNKRIIFSTGNPDLVVQKIAVLTRK